ncbi:uncharacterized protein [Anolis sagrei]|uniref:uncharacterized protein n=1 Tax=Anolis sagrei TaxID=38937 RepID=UPI00352223D1
MLTSNALWPLLIWLSISWLTVQATEPSCTHVADFGSCLGNNVLDFCPPGISCGCKDQRPFCNCPSYRKGWQNYWYLGPKCDQLWSTLDLIIVIVVPAIALSATTAVAVQWVNYCKNKEGRSAKRRSAPPREHVPQGQPNTAYVPQPVDRHVPQPRGRKDDGVAQNVKFPKLSTQSNAYEQAELPLFGGFSYAPHQPLRRVVQMGNNNRLPGPPPQRGGYVGNYEDYEEENPFTAMAMQPFPTSGSSGFPRADYYEPNHYPNGARNPYSFGRPQVKYT